MDKTYIRLFSDLAHSIEILSEQVMEFDRQKQDDNGFKAAQTMREDYSQLFDKIKDENFDTSSLTRADFARLLVGAVVISKQITNKIEQEKTALQGYNIDIIPKLERIINETETDESALNLAQQLFNIKVENESLTNE